MDPKNVAAIRNWITQNNFRYTEARAPSVSGGGFTAFFYVESLTYDDGDRFFFLPGPGIAALYTVEQHQLERLSKTDPLYLVPSGHASNPPPVRFNDKRWDANLVGGLNQSESGLLSKRATESQSSAYWELSQMSSPRGHDWMDPNIQSGGSYKYYYHDSAGEGQYIYAVEESLYLTHDEFAGKVAARQAAVLPEFTYGNEQQGGASVRLGPKMHGTRVASKAVGKVLGVAKKATIIVPQMTLGYPTGPAGSGPDWGMTHNFQGERMLDAFIRIMEHVMASDDKGPHKMGRSVINYSNGEFDDLGRSHPAVYEMLYKIIKELGSMKVLVVAAAHNEYRHDNFAHGPGYRPNGRGDDMNDVPQKRANPAHSKYLPNLIVVSTTDINTQVGNINPYANWAIFAPGAGIAVADGISGNGIQRGHDASSYGESFSASPIPPNSC